jgi:bifunctional non-homologous end joining protein LigD
MKKALRANRVFVDWSQNDDHKTTICVYSLRAKERPTVSTPVTWKEVETCLKKSDPELLAFTSDQVLQRIEKMGDPFEPVLKLKQKLPAIEALQELAGDAKLDAGNTGAAKVQSIASAAKPQKPIRRKSASKS